MTDDLLLARLGHALRPVAGLEALVLGGSRARGTAGPGSDHDLGLYYRSAVPLDVAALATVLRPLVDAPPELTPLGAWGPWIDGGGWLRIGGAKVDLLYRDLDRVGRVIEAARAGRIEMHYQPGHPHGFCSVIWMGEVALCRPLADPAGSIAALKRLTVPYPPALGRALVRQFRWEVAFAIDNAALAVPRADTTHVAGCAYRALCCMAQVLFALNGRYLINEKGALAEAATFSITLPGLAELSTGIWQAIGSGQLSLAIDLLRGLDRDLRSLVDSRTTHTTD